MVYGTNRDLKPDAMQRIVKDRGLAWPVFFDPTRAFRKSADRPTYPTATLLGSDGRIVWQGQTVWGDQFAAACEEAIRDVLR